MTASDGLQNASLNEIPVIRNLPRQRNCLKSSDTPSGFNQSTINHQQLHGVVIKRAVTQVERMARVIVK
jgi:hypothetical protein